MTTPGLKLTRRSVLGAAIATPALGAFAQTDSSDHLIIVGAGIYGLIAGLEAIQRGHRVTIIDQNKIPGPGGASYDEHRIIRRFYAVPAYARMISEAYDAWDALFETTGKNRYVETGTLTVSDGNDPSVGYIDDYLAAGYTADLLTPSQAKERFPFLEEAHVARAAVAAEGGVLLADRIMDDVAALLRTLGATLVEERRVEAIDVVNADVTLAGDGERVSGDRLLIAAGAGLPDLAPALRTQFSPRWTTAAFLSSPEQYRAAWEAAPTIFDTGGDIAGYILPPVPGTRLKFGAESFDRLMLTAQDHMGEGLPRTWWRDHFKGQFADLEDYGVEELASFPYIWTHDGRFFSTQIEKAWILSCCSGHGFKFASLIASRVIDAIEGDLSAESFGAWVAGRT